MQLATSILIGKVLNPLPILQLHCLVGSVSDTIHLLSPSTVPLNLERL